MKKYLFPLLSIMLTLSACGSSSGATPTSAPPTSLPATSAPSTPTPAAETFVTVTPVCISSQPVQADIDRVLSYSEGVFTDPEWEQSQFVSDSRVSVTWLNNPLGAVIYLEGLIFPCTYEEPDLNQYYSDENWQTIFQNYESYEMIDQCKTNTGLRLYEFKTQNLGLQYDVRFWVQNDTNTRVISTMLVFPSELQEQFDDYSSRFFPTYQTCP
ncbi:MAG: hypothetical protein KA473_02395 [Anaerolineales bacterium]|nr:hypothetical protein [Anaerolineales bacterium]MBP6208257.1 hypothetical protein [Anaerolineales bacterium]